MQQLGRLIVGDDDQIARWVAEHIPHVGSAGFGPCAAMGILSRDGSSLIAGVVYHDYQPDYGTVQISMAATSPMWATPDICRAILEIPFLQMGVNKIWTSTPQDGIRALRVNQHLGLRREAVLAHHFGKKRHAVICRMTRSEFAKLYEAK